MTYLVYYCFKHKGKIINIKLNLGLVFFKTMISNGFFKTKTQVSV